MLLLKLTKYLSQAASSSSFVIHQHQFVLNFVIPGSSRLRRSLFYQDSCKSTCKICRDNTSGLKLEHVTPYQVLLVFVGENMQENVKYQFCLHQNDGGV